MNSPQDVLLRWTRENSSTVAQKWGTSEDSSPPSSPYFVRVSSQLPSLSPPCQLPTVLDTLSRPPPHERSTSASSLAEHSTDEDSTGGSVRSVDIATSGSGRSGSDNVWIREIDEFKKSHTQRQLLSTPVTTSEEEQFIRNACASRRLHVHEAYHYNARIVLPFHSSTGLVSVVQEESGRNAGLIQKGEFSKPKFLRVARHRSACLGPRFAPYIPIALRDSMGTQPQPTPRESSQSMLLTSFVNRFGPVESVEISLDREEAILILRGLVKLWVKEEYNKHQQRRARWRQQHEGCEIDETESDAPYFSSSSISDDPLNLDDDVDEEEHTVDTDLQGTEKSPEPDLGGAVFLSGSALFGVADADSDVDAVCVVPRFVSRETFFTTFLRILRETDVITSILPISTAQVPLIRIVLKGVSIDLLMSRLPYADRVPGTLDVSDDEILEGMDYTSLISLSGPRNADIIRGLVPEFSLFCETLRNVRFWAKRRGVYSSKLGYLGGVSWAILVAFIVQLFPHASPATCLYWFFEILSKWDWNRNPIKICDNGDDSWRKSARRNSSSFGFGSPGIVGLKQQLSSIALGSFQEHSLENNSHTATTSGGSVPVSPETPKLAHPRVSSTVSLPSCGAQSSFGEVESDKGSLDGIQLHHQMGGSKSLHLMPIITPSCPVSDSSSSVTYSTKTTLQMEFSRARSIVRQFYDNSQKHHFAQSQGLDDEALLQQVNLGLFELFAPFAVYNEFSDYIRIDISAEDQETWEPWVALVASRLRKLTTLLESVPCVERVRIDPHCYVVDNIAGEEMLSKVRGNFYVGIEKTHAAQGELTSNPDAKAEHNEVISRTVSFFGATHLGGQADGLTTFQLELVTKGQHIPIERSMMLTTQTPPPPVIKALRKGKKSSHPSLPQPPPPKKSSSTANLNRTPSPMVMPASPPSNEALDSFLPEIESLGPGRGLLPSPSMISFASYQAPSTETDEVDSDGIPASSSSITSFPLTRKSKHRSEAYKRRQRRENHINTKKKSVTSSTSSSSSVTVTSSDPTGQSILSETAPVKHNLDDEEKKDC